MIHPVALGESPLPLAQPPILPPCLPPPYALSVTPLCHAWLTPVISPAMLLKLEVRAMSSEWASSCIHVPHTRDVTSHEPVGSDNELRVCLDMLLAHWLCGQCSAVPVHQLSSRRRGFIASCSPSIALLFWAIQAVSESCCSTGCCTIHQILEHP